MPPKVILGLMGSSVASGSSRISTPAHLTSILQLAKTHQVLELDTARVYGAGQSESLLGACTPLSHTFAISTKAPGFSPGSLTPEKIVNNCNASLSALKVDKLDIYYFHGPDRKTPLLDSCRAIDQLYREGKFARFGVSNFTAAEVEETYEICKGNGWVLPSVYQGGYNPLLRKAEFELFPTLRKLGIGFYAYSPLGGGFFSRPLEELRREPEEGSRMEQMKIFREIYVSEKSLKLLEDLTEVCKENWVGVREATLRWLMHHGPLEGEKGDGVVLGASSLEQVEGNLEACQKGKSPKSVVKAFEEMWVGYKDVAWPYHV